MSDAPAALVVAGGSGIGADAARKLAADGYRVGVMSSSGKGEELGNELGGLGFTGSNLEPADLQAFADAAMERFGRIDGVVNGAGHGPKGEVLEISDDDWHTGMEVYLLNVVRMTRIVTPIMLAQGGGSIVNISTIDAAMPSPLTVAYSATKFAVEGITRVAALELRADKIRVNVVNAGFGSKDLVIDATGRFRAPQAVIDAHDHPEQISAGARTVLFLASDDSSIVTGATLAADNGFTAGMPLPTR